MDKVKRFVKYLESKCNVLSNIILIAVAIVGILWYLNIPSKIAELITELLISLYLPLGIEDKSIRRLFTVLSVILAVLAVIIFVR